jgi:excisionase family DNA binding protein
MKQNILDILTVDEFAEILKVHPNTVRYQIKTGRIQAFRASEGKKAPYRIFRSEIERMAAFDAREMIENIVKERMK